MTELDLTVDEHGYVQVRWPATGPTIDLSLYDPTTDRLVSESIPLRYFALPVHTHSWFIDGAFRRMVHKLQEVPDA